MKTSSKEKESNEETLPVISGRDYESPSIINNYISEVGSFFKNKIYCSINPMVML